jgi:predicted dienelactone hydrolase
MPYALVSTGLPAIATPTAHPGVDDDHFEKISSTDLAASGAACSTGMADNDAATNAPISSVRSMRACYNIALMRPALIALLLLVPGIAGAQTNRIDTITPFAPELAPYGANDIGVRTIQVIDKNRPDILNIKEGGPTVRYDRPLTLEVWYPATLAAGQKPGGEYRVVTRDPAVTVTLHGKAVRQAAPRLRQDSGKAGSAPYPLVIVSHGYPGDRLLMGHLGETLASKGFVVVAIEHTESTYWEQKAFASTLYNRPFDQLFVLNEIDRLSKPGSGSFLSGIVDTSNTGIVGYSMGGYGLVNVIGGGYAAAAAATQQAPPNKMLLERSAANPDYQKARDPRIKAAIAVAPWGMQAGYWDNDGLKGIRTPTMFIAGSNDTVAGYEKGTHAIFDGAVNADRYMLTFLNANHNAAAPIPSPIELYGGNPTKNINAFAHYADPVWDTARMNNIFDHFAAAFFGLQLKHDESMRAYLDLPQNGKDGWKGFARNAAVGLTLEHKTPER